MTEQLVSNSQGENMDAFGRVAVLYGGTSSEREVSLQSGERVFQALVSKGVDAVLIDAADDLVGQLIGIRPDRVFLAMHGSPGEDGTVQGMLELLSIPYTGSGVAASALAMDKYRSKLVWGSLGLPTPAFAHITAGSDYDIDALPVPCFLKPNNEGSSICTFPVYNREELKAGVEKVLEHAGEVLVEQLVEGPEFTVSVLNGKALPGIRMDTDNTFYDYEAKYLSEETRYSLPCGLSEEKEQELRELALVAFNSLGCTDLGRVDVMQDQDGKFWLLEVNTVPGMTSHSLVPMAAKAVGLDFEDLVLELLKTAG